MKPSREQCLKWAEEAGLCTLIATYKGVWQEDALEALCQRVWNEAIEAAASLCLKERAALEQNREVWKENPMFLPTEEYIAEWESSACRGEEYAEEIRKLKVTP